jgi:hypothetical protein
MHPGGVVTLGESAGVSSQALHDEMHFSVGVINLPWLILYLLQMSAVASFTLS